MPLEETQTTQTTQQTEQTSLLNGGAATTTAAPTEFVPDATKTAEENAAAKTAFDTAAAEAKKVADEKIAAEAKTAVEKDAAAKANDTKVNPFKVEEIKLPEGMTIDEAATKPFVEIVNKFGLPRDAVTELVNLQAKVMSDASEKGSADWNTLQDDWRTQVQSDPDIGGTKTAPTLGAISKLIDEFGTPELRTAFDLTGAGNNPHVIKFLAKLSGKLTEGGYSPATVPGSGQLTAAERMFPNQGKT